MTFRHAAATVGLAVTIGCNAAPFPYPPDLRTDRLTLIQDSPGSLTLTGEAGAVTEGGLRLRVRNATRPVLPADVRAAADGSFRAVLRGIMVDTLRIDGVDDAWFTIAHIASGVGDGVVRTGPPTDTDHDGFAATAECRDGDPRSFPGAAERCDLADNDCDGATDEPPACACTADGDCDDGYFCNGAEVCVGGSCADAGEPVICDDGDPTTVDLCDPSYDACTHSGEPDPVAAFCGNGIVEPGEECDDGNSISGDGCEPDCTVTGSCTPTPEICNGLDDDCDGMVDEDFDLASDPLNCGACGYGCDDGDPATTDLCVDGICRSW